MNPLAKKLFLLLCCLFYIHATRASFLFHNGQKARQYFVFDYPTLQTTTADQLPEDLTLIFADVTSPFADQAKIVTIAPNNSKTEWIVSSITIKDPSWKKCKSLQEAQSAALSLLQPQATPVVYPPRPPKNTGVFKNPKKQQWRKT